jgi:hypothetical protein
MRAHWFDLRIRPASAEQLAPAHSPSKVAGANLRNRTLFSIAPASEADDYL